MGMKCANCGKGVMYGHNVSHSKRRTKRLFKPNLHEVRISVGNLKQKMKLCTKCLRQIKSATKSEKLTSKIVPQQPTAIPV